MSNPALTDDQVVSDQLKSIEEAQAAYSAELAARQRVEFSEEYIALNRQEDELKMLKAALVEKFEDKKLLARLEALKMSLFAYMENMGLERIGRYKGKYKEKKGVNTMRVLDVLGGDIDHFLKMSSITQVALEAFAKTEGGERKDRLMDCVEVVERKLVDIVPIETR